MKEKKKILKILKNNTEIKTTAKVASEAELSWHMTQQILMELNAEGKVKRYNVGKYYVWFPLGWRP